MLNFLLNSNGSVVGSQLYRPYGNKRYSTGTLPTRIGFTGQHADRVMGLDYYNARFYDPVAGVFLSPDSVQGNAQGMDPYSYVGGNPETRTDPTGKRFTCPNGCGGGGDDGGGNGGGGGGTPTCNSTTCSDGSGNSQPNPTRHWHPVPTNTGCSGGGGTHASANVCAGTGTQNQSTDPCVNNGRCQSDRDHIKSYLQGQANHWHNVAIAIGDGIALAADVLALVLEIAASDWRDVALEALSIIARGAALVGDLAKLGVFSMPAWVSSALQAIKWVANVLDTVGAFLNWFNPLAPVEDGLKKVAWWMKPKLVSFILSIATTSSAGGTIAAPKVLDAAYWDNQITAVDSYDAQRAYSECVNDNPAKPAGYC